MERYIKFLSKLDAKTRDRLVTVIFRIANGDLKNLDVKMLHSEYEVYRCRVGKLRILFQKTEFGNVVMDIGWRGDVYKDF